MKKAEFVQHLSDGIDGKSIKSTLILYTVSLIAVVAIIQLFLRWFLDQETLYSNEVIFWTTLFVIIFVFVYCRIIPFIVKYRRRKHQSRNE